MIGIIGAMQSETEALIAALEAPTAETVSGITYTKGILEGKAVVIATCGKDRIHAKID